MFKIGLLDYGMGNLHSVSKALLLNNPDVVTGSKPSAFKDCRLLVVPGVGSFGAAMENLAKNGMDDFVRAWISDGKAYLGICLGLQLLFERSEESPGVKGLGVLKGKVVKFKKADFKKGPSQIPHMGWNTAAPTKENASLFKGLRADDYFYFVHSFYPAPADRSVIMTETAYGKNFCSSVRSGRVIATQFHLEKSGETGLKLLGNVIRLAKEELAPVHS